MVNYLLGIEEQELSVLLTGIVNVDFGPRGKGYVDAITLPQLDRVTADIDLDSGASGGVSIVAGPLNEVGVNIGALGCVGEGSGRREDGSEDVKWRVDWGRASSLALVDNLQAVLNSRCHDMRPSISLAFIGEMSGVVLR